MKKLMRVILLICLLCGAAAVCGYASDKTAAGSSEAAAGSSSEQEQAVTPELSDYKDLAGKTVSMLTGAPFEELVRSKEPGVGQFTFYSNTPDMILALRSGKTDAMLTNNAIAALTISRNAGLTLFPQELDSNVFGFAFQKGNPDRALWEEACGKITDETKQALWKKWTGADEGAKVLPEQDWPGTNGTVTVAACDTLEPMSYLGEGGQVIGFDIEMTLLAARMLDVHVKFEPMEFSALLSSVQAGKALFGTGSIIATDERRESVDFVDYFPAAFVLVVRAEGSSPEKASFWQSIGESFEKTFIREERYKLFLQGIGTTLLITVLSVVIGTLLGFGVYMLCRRGNPAANAVTGFFVWLVQGMPVVVLLMILYYIVFGKLSVSGTLVSIVAFVLIFGVAVYGLLKAGVGAVDPGQAETACALGYTERKAFFRIVLPQALPHVMPAYKGEIISLLKATSIVGYIAVQDLTKMGDIVRSRTYEAFFPLIAVTVIYFILAAALIFFVERIDIRLDPKRRKPEEILKGLKPEA